MYYSLQILRGMAALIVVLFHLGGTFASDKYFGYDFFASPFSFGHSGVQFFFVLSGYIIYSVHKSDISKPNRLLIFFKKRAIRIYPVYILIFSLIYISAFFSPLRETLPNDFLTLLKTIFLLPQETSPVIGVAWTLQYEVVFYVIFSLLILNKNIFLFVISILIYFNFFIEDSGNLYINMLQNNNVYLFAFGVFIAWCKNNFSVTLNSIILLIGLTLYIGVSINNLTIEDKTLLYGIASSLIIYSIVSLEKQKIDFKKYHKLNILGDASYSLYLWHTALISLFLKIFFYFGILNLGLYGALLSYLLILLFVIFFSVLFHLYVERKIIRYLNNKFIR